MSTDIQSHPASVGGEHRRPAVVVGVDGSERNLAAIEYAVAIAEAARRPVTLVAVVDDYAVPIPHHAVRTDSDGVWQVLTRLAAAIEADHPGLVVRMELQSGNTVAQLVSRSAYQACLVVGKRGLGTFGRLLVGSTAIAAAGRSQVPVVVVPDGWRLEDSRDRAVVAGVSVDQDAQAGLRYAFAQAGAWGVPLQIVNALDIPLALGWDTTLGPPAYEQREERNAAALEDVVAPYRKLFPEVSAAVRVLRGHAGPVLLHQSAAARLLVLGRHDEGRFGFGLGSVARGVLHYSQVPVAVVPNR